MSGVIRIDYTITRGDIAPAPLQTDADGYYVPQGKPAFAPSSEPVTDAMYVSGDLDPWKDSETWKMLVGGMLHHKVVRDLTNGP